MTPSATGRRLQAGITVRALLAGSLATAALVSALLFARVTPATANQEPTRVPRSVIIVGVGDILTHREIIDQARADSRGSSPDFYRQLQGIESVVAAADLAVCHIEFPMGSTKGPWTAWPDLPAGPPQLAEAVADVGFDTCSTASNHSFDQGFRGVTRVLNALDRSGVAHAGTARTAEEAATPTILDVNGVAVAHLSYTYSFNGMPVPEGREWSANLISVPRIIKEAKRARALGAQIVVLSLHAGDEGQQRPSVQQVDVVSDVAASGLVDLVIGHHAHVIQPVDRVNGLWVAYGHGNLLSAQSRRDPRSGDGLLSRFTFTEQSDGSFEVSAAEGFVVRNDDYPFRLSIVPRQRDATWGHNASWKRARAAVMDLGADQKGFRLLRWTPVG